MFYRTLDKRGLLKLNPDRAVEQYKLVSEFSRKMYDHGGSCIYVKKGIRTKELNCFTGISVEKEFEMSATELVDFGFIIVCILYCIVLHCIYFPKFHIQECIQWM